MRSLHPDLVSEHLRPVSGPHGGDVVRLACLWVWFCRRYRGRNIQQKNSDLNTTLLVAHALEEPSRTHHNRFSCRFRIVPHQVHRMGRPGRQKNVYRHEANLFNSLHKKELFPESVLDTILVAVIVAMTWEALYFCTQAGQKISLSCMMAVSIRSCSLQPVMAPRMDVCSQFFVVASHISGWMTFKTRFVIDLAIHLSAFEFVNRF